MWQDLIINEYIPQREENGFDGLFLDTMDRYHLEDRYPVSTKERMIDFIKNISSEKCGRLNQDTHTIGIFSERYIS